MRIQNLGMLKAWRVTGLLFPALLFTVHVSVASAATSLVQAARAGDLGAVRALLDKGSDANEAEVDGTTALHWAARRGDLQIVLALLRAGADAGARNRYGVAPLLLAAGTGDPAVVRALLVAGADAKTASPEGETALMIAASQGNPDVMNALIASGADVNAREQWRGQTALMWAAAVNNAKAVDILIAHGADVGARSKSAGGEAKGRNASRASGGGFTAYLFAVRGGHFETTRALLTAGAPANETLPDGTSALHLAVMNAHYELAAFLLDRGADANASGPGWTPLHQLAWTRRPNIGQVNPPPVQTGAMDSLELAKVLFAHGADPNARQAKEPRDGNRNLLKRVGATPFLLAAKGCDPDFMRLLVAQGADPLLTTADGATPLMAAAGVGIYIAGESPGTDAEAVQALKAIVELSGGRHDVNAVDANGDTALHGATYRGSAAVVQYLVELGGRLDVVNKKGWTPLNIADGVVYNAVFNSYPEAAALIRKLMRERGLPFEEKPSRATDANHGA